jgi:hypothetical protein
MELRIIFDYEREVLDCLTLENGMERSSLGNNQRCATSQKKEDLTYFKLNILLLFYSLIQYNYLFVRKDVTSCII